MEDRSSAWRVAVDSLGLSSSSGNDGMSSLALAESCECGTRLKVLIVMVESVTQNNMDVDGIASLVDETGRCTAHLHSDVLKSPDIELRNGTVLVLKDTVVMATRRSRCLNVRADNVVVALPPDAAPPSRSTKRELVPLPRPWIDRWCTRACGLDVPDDFEQTLTRLASAQVSELRQIHSRLSEDEDTMRDVVENALEMRRVATRSSKRRQVQMTCFCGSSNVDEDSLLCLDCGNKGKRPPPRPLLPSSSSLSQPLKKVSPKKKKSEEKKRPRDHIRDVLRAASYNKQRRRENVIVSDILDRLCTVIR